MSSGKWLTSSSEEEKMGNVSALSPAPSAIPSPTEPLAKEDFIEGSGEKSDGATQ
jgi:hypothetical protein